jgi:hypothetical protein
MKRLAGVGSEHAVLARLRDNRGDSSTRDECCSRCAGLVSHATIYQTPSDRTVETGTKDGCLKKSEDLREARA